MRSGHGAMKENYYLDDGTYSASQIIVETVKRRLEGHGDITQELLRELQEPAEAHEFRLKLKVWCSQYRRRQVCWCHHDDHHCCGRLEGHGDVTHGLLRELENLQKHMNSGLTEGVIPSDDLLWHSTFQKYCCSYTHQLAGGPQGCQPGAAVEEA